MKQRAHTPIQAGERKVFAICGKGGAGKTAFSAMLIRVLLDRGDAGKLLVIDADPALGLSHAIGVPVEKTIGQAREAVITTAKARKQTETTEVVGMLDYMIMEALVETEGLSLLAMGRTETLGCFCSVNDLLRGAVTHLSQSFDTIIIDCEAGLEQINRQVMDNVAILLILSDATSRGIQTVRTIHAMVEKEKIIRCRNLGLVFNKIRDNEEVLKRYAQDIGIEVFGYVPDDEHIANYDLVGKSLLELPRESSAQNSVRSIVDDVIFRP